MAKSIGFVGLCFLLFWFLFCVFGFDKVVCPFYEEVYFPVGDIAVEVYLNPVAEAAVYWAAYR